ncbi:sensor histidine kinase [Paenibacillus graminis]|uniref:Histidine kinase n=1 Tax=Paenibacillus graminis TaxID=189425 RepID=A0A089NMB4_9BACL|nr:sensor histidine kinase [Paenibacillus graminis]AIQ70199.1 histidine kinase [Paenibacillus graminis]
MINPFKKYRIDRLFFHSFAIVLIAVIGVTAWTSYSNSSKALVQTTSHYQQQLLDELNNEITTRLVMIEQISLSSSRDSELTNFLLNRQDEFERYRSRGGVESALANLTYAIPLIQGIDLYMDNPIPSERQSYIQFRDLADLNKQVGAGCLEKSDFCWSREYNFPSVQGEVPVLSFSRKIISENDYLGVLVVHIKANEIRKLLTGNSDGSNRIMADSEGQQIMKIGDAMDQNDWSRWIDLKSNKSGYVHIPATDGSRDTLLVYSRMDNSIWTLIEFTSWKQITASSLKLAEWIGLIGIAAVLLVLLLTHFLSKQFTKPIKNLVTAMRVYSVGGDNVELPVDYENEFGYLFSGYRKQNERIEELYLSLERRYEQQRKAEIEALQANINPHFLYNMLDQLNWMAIEAGQDELSRILELMGRMFRIGLSNGNSFITIADELLHIECYLEIQQLRWGEGLEYRIEAASGLQELYIPKLTLQPFVENSIVHGFNKQRSGYVSIVMERLDDTLHIVIDDNGAGLKQPDHSSHKRHTGGYGIRNVRERITGYFGESYGITLSEREEGGTRVEIMLPLLPEPPAGKD